MRAICNHNYKTTALRWLGVFAMVLQMLTGSAPVGAQSQRVYVLTTATTGGTFYPVGVAMATLTKVRLAPTQGVALAAISSAGSAENLKLLRTGEAQFAILQALYGAWAWRGEGPMAANGAQIHLRAVTRLWSNVEHFVLSEGFVREGTLADLGALDGARFAIGKRNSGSAGSGEHILRALGVQQAFEPVYLGYGAAAEAMLDGTTVGMNAPAGPPSGAITRLLAARGGAVQILAITDAQLEAINRRYPLWSRYAIPANTYPQQPLSVASAAQPNFLAVHADVDADAVYWITRTLYENLGFLQAIHSATGELSLETATDGLPVPLHPGAERYYREQGIEVAAPQLAP